jgi:hypothetical protein
MESAAGASARRNAMIYYTIYVKGLNNQTGYIDVALEDDQLMKDYNIFLDIGLKAHKPYPIANVACSRGKSGQFIIDLACIAAITLNLPS